MGIMKMVSGHISGMPIFFCMGLGASVASHPNARIPILIFMPWFSVSECENSRVIMHSDLAQYSISLLNCNCQSVCRISRVH